MGIPKVVSRFMFLLGCLCTAQASFSEVITLTEPDEPAPIRNPVLRASLSKTQDRSLSLRQALEIAQENNPDYKASLSQVKQARAAYLTQWASLLPDFSGSINYAKINATLPGVTDNFGFGGGGLPSTLSINTTTFFPYVRFSYPVFKGGTRIFQILAARKTLHAQKAQAESTLEQTLQQTAEAYYSMKRQLEQIAIAQKQIDESTEQLQINRSRLEVGVGTNLDVLQSQSQLSQAQQDLLTAYQEAESQASRLNELLNLPAIIAIVPEQPIQDIHTLIPAQASFAYLLDVAHQNRPEVRKLQAQIASLGQTRNTVISGYLPNVNLEYINGALGTNANDTKHLDLSLVSVGINLKHMGISGITEFVEDTAKIEEQRHRLQSQLNAIDKALSDAYMKSITTLAQIDVSRIQITAAEQALSDAIERLKAGVGKNIDVTDAQVKLTQARSNLCQAIQDYNLAQVNLVFNLGLASVETLTQGISHL